MRRKQENRLSHDGADHPLISFIVDWKIISSESDLEAIKQNSRNKPQVIFKHSTRCSISSLAKNRLERNEISADIDFHFLDLLRFRNISNKIESDFSVCHESPQVLLIKNGKCIYDESHNAISMKEIEQEANKSAS